MSDKDKKLDFDLGFLDEESPKPKQTIRKKQEEEPESEFANIIKRHWKIIAVVGGVLLIVILAASDDGMTSTPTYTPPSTNQARNISADNDIVEYGEYRCSQHHYNKAVALSPSESEQTLKSAQFSMELRASELERLGNDLEYSYVTEYSSQWEIDSYNTKVNTHNSKLASYQRDATALDSRIDRFNTQVAAHNNYLTQNCTPK